jgi:hypothetical protein
MPGTSPGMTEERLSSLPQRPVVMGPGLRRGDGNYASRSLKVARKGWAG